MTSSWRPGCPVPLWKLRYLRVSFWGFDGKVRTGELVVRRSQAWPMVRAFNLKDRHRELREQNRAYVVLDVPGITAQQRLRLAGAGRRFIGKWYDVGQFLLFGFTGRFWSDGQGTVICSRYITAAVKTALGVDIFTPESLSKHYPSHYSRGQDLLAGYCLPVDLLKSTLKVTEFRPSKTIPFL
jgi:hypothetical protein